MAASVTKATVLAQRKSLTSIYRNASQRIKDELSRGNVTIFRATRLAQLESQIDRIVLALDAAVVKEAQAIAETSYEYGSVWSGRALRRQGISFSDIDMGARIHVSAVERVADQIASDLLSANMSLQETSKRVLRATQQVLLKEQQINERIAQGIIMGQDARSASMELAHDLLQAAPKDNPFVEIMCKDGVVRQWDVREYADLVVRTQSREAVTAGTMAAAKEYGVEAFQITVHEGACEYCQQFQGKVYSIDGKGGFPPLVSKPPYHPRCEHNIMPFVVEAFEDSEVARFQKLSHNDKAVIWGEDDFQRVLNGGRPHTKPTKFDAEADLPKPKKAANPKGRPKTAPKKEGEGDVVEEIRRRSAIQGARNAKINDAANRVVAEKLEQGYRLESRSQAMTGSVYMDFVRAESKEEVMSATVVGQKNVEPTIEWMKKAGFVHERTVNQPKKRKQIFFRAPWRVETQVTRRVRVADHSPTDWRTESGTEYVQI